MYESEIRLNKHYFRSILLPRPPPDSPPSSIGSHSPYNRRYGSQNTINPPLLIRNQMKQLKFLIPVIALCLMLGTGRASAQWTVIDPSNIAQSIVNSSKSLVQESTTATNMVRNFQETVKIYEQGKKYYDALKSVNNLVKDAVKVRNTILMIGEISDIYVTNFQLMLRDGNFTPEELSAIAFGYTKLLEESNNVLKEMKDVVNITTLSMTDKERMDVVERCYSKMRRYRNLVSYYTNKNISVSYLRAKKKNDLDRIMGLYGNMNERYW